ncbi:hypothetical protein C5167_009333 [Papaver somniferum]|uniref:Uncharacterized protein n=1 Tax=Papaver somniferum TaxID=3469 RepID=A0A4Y7JY70_PAPSO|nr:hypothetical protein C5167_009333 [Papaver somniferum]
MTEIQDTSTRNKKLCFNCGKIASPIGPILTAVLLFTICWCLIELYEIKVLHRAVQHKATMFWKIAGAKQPYFRKLLVNGPRTPFLVSNIYVIVCRCEVNAFLIRDEKILTKKSNRHLLQLRDDIGARKEISPEPTQCTTQLDVITMVWLREAHRLLRLCFSGSRIVAAIIKSTFGWITREEIWKDLYGYDSKHEIFKDCANKKTAVPIVTHVWISTYSQLHFVLHGILISLVGIIPLSLKNEQEKLTSYLSRLCSFFETMVHFKLSGKSFLYSQIPKWGENSNIAFLKKHMRASFVERPKPWVTNITVDSINSGDFLAISKIRGGWGAFETLEKWVTGTYVEHTAVCLKILKEIFGLENLVTKMRR